MILTVLAVLAAAEVGLPLLLVAAKNRLLFFPGRSPPESGTGWFGPGVVGTVVAFPRGDGLLRKGYDVRPEGAGGAAPDPPVTRPLHGTAGSLADRAGVAGDFARGTGLRVLFVEYTGFGGTPGSPSEEEILADGLAAFDHLVKEGVPPARIVIYGESIGGAVALAVAARRKPAGVIAQSSFSSLSSMALRIHPWLPLAALFVRGDFRSVDRIREYGGPVLVVHGRRDSIVPFAEGEELAKAGGKLATLLPLDNADHNDLLDVGGRNYLEELGAWVKAR